MILLIYGGGSLGREIYDLVCRNYPPPSALGENLLY